MSVTLLSLKADACLELGVVLLLKVFLNLGSLEPPDQWEPQPALLPLTPTEELEDHRSAFSSGDTAFSLLQNPPDHMDLFAQDPSQDFSVEDNMNLLTHHLVDTLERSSGDFLFGENDVEDEDGLPSPLNDLMVDTAILDEIRLLDLALEEGFSPEVATRLDEAGHLLPDVAQQEPGRGDIHSQSNLRGDQVQPGDSQQGSRMRL